MRISKKKAVVKKAKPAMPAGMGANPNNFVFETGIKVHRRAKVVIPFSLAGLMNYVLMSLDDKSNEFGLFLNSRVDEKDPMRHVIDLSLPWTLPEQEVTSTHIDFKETFGRDKYNTVIHRHPNGVNRFSPTDAEYINESFDVSVLFVPRYDFPDALVNIKVASGNYIQMPAETVVQFSPPAVGDNVLKGRMKDPNSVVRTSRMHMEMPFGSGFGHSYNPLTDPQWGKRTGDVPPKLDDGTAKRRDGLFRKPSAVSRKPSGNPHPVTSGMLAVAFIKVVDEYGFRSEAIKKTLAGNAITYSKEGVFERLLPIGNRTVEMALAMDRFHADMNNFQADDLVIAMDKALDRMDFDDPKATDVQFEMAEVLKDLFLKNLTIPIYGDDEL